MAELDILGTQQIAAAAHRAWGSMKPMAQAPWANSLHDDGNTSRAQSAYAPPTELSTIIGDVELVCYRALHRCGEGPAPSAATLLNGPQPAPIFLRRQRRVTRHT